jgi:hypothetical protein
LCSRTVHVLLRQGEGQKGRKRLGQQPSHVTSGSARYNNSDVCCLFLCLGETRKTPCNISYDLGSVLHSSGSSWKHKHVEYISISSLLLKKDLKSPKY